ncbi:MAG: hypothetical protein QOG62_2841 [Thermoleophilaceae bacterium]|jgi:hypothetical protein|nr:hypothetical protein [Thermoleophilaceae bacterium]
MPPEGGSGGYGAPPPPGGYGGPPPGGYGAQPKNSTLAIVSLVTGIIGILPCCWGFFLFGLVGLITGFIAKGQIEGSNGAQTGRGMAVAGMILGGVAVALGIIYWILIATGAIDINAYRGDFESS